MKHQERTTDLVAAFSNAHAAAAAGRGQKLPTSRSARNGLRQSSHGAHGAHASQNGSAQSAAAPVKPGHDATSAARDKGSAVAGLHAARDPFRSGTLKVTNVHTVAYSEYGNPRGVPVIVVHGGPGAACFPRHAQFFDLKRYRVVLLDQRGCGASTPTGCLVDNNTQALISDMETLREHLGLQAWMLFAGSWGVTLALAYSLQHPNRVLAMILRGVCLMRRHEIDWVFRGGCKALFPAAWAAFVAGLSPDEFQDPLRAYYARLTSNNADVRQSASKRMFLLQAALGLPAGDQVQVWDGSQWDRHELASWSPSATLPRTAAPQSASKAAAASTLPPYSLPPNEAFAGFPESSGFTSAQQLLTAHYSMQNGFLGPEDLLRGLDSIRMIPAIAVQGRNDMVCPVATAYDLHLAWPELELQVVTAAGHSMYDDNIAQALLKATIRMDSLLREKKKRAQKGRAV